MTECVSVTPPRPLSAFTVRELTGRRCALEQTLDTLPVTEPALAWEPAQWTGPAPGGWGVPGLAHRSDV